MQRQQTAVPKALLRVPEAFPYSSRSLINTVFFQELRVNLSVFRLMKVLTFNEAEFRWTAVRFDNPKTFTIVDVQKLIHDHFVKQLLKQWWVMNMRICLLLARLIGNRG